MLEDVPSNMGQDVPEFPAVTGGVQRGWVQVGSSDRGWRHRWQPGTAIRGGNSWKLCGWGASWSGRPEALWVEAVKVKLGTFPRLQ
eukprot:s3208_g7.t1